LEESGGQAVNDPLLLLLGRYFLAIVVVVLIVPLGGGGILWKSFQLAGIGDVTYRQCCRAYFLACLYAYAIALGLNLVLLSRGTVLALGAFCAVPLVVVPISLRKFNRRALLAQFVAVGLTDLVVVAGVVLAR
jgi:hypothetical protein